MTHSEDDASAPRAPVQQVQFHYIKSNGFREIHVDGAVGSITPRGLFHAAIFSERLPIPRMMIHRITPEGTLGPLVEQDIRPGVVREVEVGLLFDRVTAESLRNWLTDQIAKHDEATAAAGRRTGAVKE